MGSKLKSARLNSRNKVSDHARVINRGARGSMVKQDAKVRMRRRAELGKGKLRLEFGIQQSTVRSKLGQQGVVRKQERRNTDQKVAEVYPVLARHSSFL